MCTEGKRSASDAVAVDHLPMVVMQLWLCEGRGREAKEWAGRAGRAGRSDVYKVILLKGVQRW